MWRRLVNKLEIYDDLLHYDTHLDMANPKHHIAHDVKHDIIHTTQCTLCIAMPLEYITAEVYMVMPLINPHFYLLTYLQNRTKPWSHLTRKFGEVVTHDTDRYYRHFDHNTLHQYLE